MQRSVVDIRNIKFTILILTGTVIILPFVSVRGNVLRMPEFAEPIKNVTLPTGSDVELSCDVRHLGTYRVTWSWKKDEEQKFLAIGIVKITHNPRIHISRIQKSDDVTQFNLYVYNVKIEDEGTYYCSVNSNPMIEQIGTLDIVDDTSVDKVHHFNNKDNNGKIFSGQRTIPLIEDDSTSSNDASLSSNGTLENSFLAMSNGSTSATGSESLSISQNEDSTVLCIDLGEVWENARERFSQFLSELMKFTYSYWFS